MAAGPDERLELLQRDLDREIVRIQRQRERNKFQAFGFRIFTVAASAATTVLLGLKITGNVEEIFTGAALVLSAMATVALAVNAFYDPRGLWIIEVRQLARLQALGRRLADQTARSTSLTHEDVDRLRDDFESLMEAHLTAWTSLREQSVQAPPPGIPETTAPLPIAAKREDSRRSILAEQTES